MDGPTAAPNIGFHGNIRAKRVEVNIGSTPSSPRGFQSNIPSRDLPFVGRDELLDRIREILVDPLLGKVVVLHGQAGVGKSELAREFARRERSRYPGGTFIVDAREDAIVVELARIGRTRLGIDFPSDLRLEDQCLRTLSVLGAASSLLIFDNALSPNNILPWLPPSGMPCHAVITSLVDCWDLGWPIVSVDQLSELASLELIDRVGGTDIPAGLRQALAAQAQGLPVQIVPVCRTMRRAVGRGRIDSVRLTLTKETAQSFGGVYAHLDPSARLLIHAASRMNSQRIICKELEGNLLRGAGWSVDEFERHLSTCLDLTILEGQAELHMHQLFASFVLDKASSEDSTGASQKIAQDQACRMIQLATQLVESPNRADVAGMLMTYGIQLESWKDHDKAISSIECGIVGRALLEIGHFAAARPWFARAVSEAEKGDVHGRVDHEELGKHLYGVGDCLRSTGEFAAARSWFERAVAVMEAGNIHGPVDRASLGTSLHMVGYCLCSSDEYTAARPWFERAVAEKQRGDACGQVDHQSIGTSLHQVGDCLSIAGQLAAARPWFERAVAEAEKGDIRGRVDHETLGTSLHAVGHCLSGLGEFAAARPWFERAVTEAKKGDVYGRVDHQSIGASLHQVGDCVFSAGEFVAARPLFESAIAETEKGDVHGRIDHGGLGKSLHSVGDCLTSVGEFVTARLWFERACAEKEKGDVHGRVDHYSLSISMYMVGDCLKKIKAFAAARPWFERAIAETAKGDVYGRVDHESLGNSLHAVGECMRAIGELATARGWFERAIAEKKKGDIYGRVNDESIAASLHIMSDCLEAEGGSATAPSQSDRTAAQAEKGEDQS